MKKNIIIISILLLLIPALAYSGYGIMGEKQPDHDFVFKNWKKGDEIPGYLLEDNSKYNYLSLYTPAAYIKSIDNVELLWSLLFYPELPESNFYCTTYHLLNIVGEKKFGITLKKKSAQYSNENLQRLENNFKGKCLKIYQISIRKKYIPYEEASQILEKIKKDIVKYDFEYVQKVCHKWQNMYEYTNEQGLRRTKITNGGHFYFSAYTNKIFSTNLSDRKLNKETVSELSRAKEGDLIIVQEYVEGYDKVLRARYANVATDTEDRMTLYIILEEI